MAIKPLFAASEGTEFKHNAGHNLESLLNTMLTVCLYTTGPCGELREDSIKPRELIKMNEWFIEKDRGRLAAVKSITLEAFSTYIAPKLPNYWTDFTPYLHRLINATWRKMPYIEQPNSATYEAYRSILKEALLKYAQEENVPLGPYASILTPKDRKQLSQAPVNRSKRPSEDSLLIPKPAKRTRSRRIVVLDTQFTVSAETGQSSSKRD